MVFEAMLIFIAANILFEAAGVFYNGLLPELASPADGEDLGVRVGAGVRRGAALPDPGARASCASGSRRRTT
jgi:hypothetical protein